MRKKSRIKYCGIIILFFFVFFLSFIWGVDPDFAFNTPTKKQINTLKTIIDDMTKQMIIIDNEISDVKKSAENARLFYLKNINSKTIPPDNSLKIWIDEKKKNWEKIEFKTILTNDMIKDLETTVIQASEVTLFYESILPFFKFDVDDFYKFITGIASRPTGIWLIDTESLINLELEFVQTNGDSIYYAMWTFLSVLPESIVDSYNKQWPLFINFPQERPNSYNEADLNAQKELEKLEKSELEIGTIVADNDKFIQKWAINLKEDAIKKFTATNIDSIEIIWFKALILLRLNLRKEAISNFEIFLEKAMKTDPNAFIYIPIAINFIKAIDQTGIYYGAIVTEYETGKSHKEIKIGDIIINIDDQKVVNADSYGKIKTAMTKKTFKIKVLRFYQDGTWQILSINYNKNDCKFRVYSLMEKD